VSVQSKVAQPADVAAQWSMAANIRRHAQERPDAPMLTFGDRTISYGEMGERSSRAAQGLLAEGVGSQERIAFLDKNTPEYFEVAFGGSKINAVLVAVNWRLSPREMEYVINDGNAKVLVVGQEFLPHLEEMESGLETVQKIIVLGEHPKHESYETWIGRQDSQDPGTVAAATDVSVQLYTSGTTGLPKGAMLSNANLGTLVPYVAPAWQFDETSVNLVCMPLYHIGGSGWANVGVHFGCHSIMVRELVPQEILDLMEKHRITNAFFVPALLNFLTMVPGAADRDFSALRNIVYGASPITEDALLRAMQTFKCDFTQVYGLTETTGAITELKPSEHDPGGPRAHLLRSAGRPYDWVEIKMADPDTGQEVETGKVGELWTRSVQNMLGYWNLEDATKRAVTDDGWFRTGDAGYRDEEGFIFLTDRINDMIISGGENIYPIEVESALSTHPGIADIAVIGIPDDNWGEAVKAVVVRRPGTDATAEEIIAYGRERLATYKNPRSVDFVDELPRNPTGKLLKKVLRDPYWQGQERRVH
jgi:long-chain acyl-CoA synthetase